MHQKIKKFIINFIPPAVIDFYLNFIDPYGFSGEYKDWETAQRLSVGYDSEIILNKTKNAALKVKKGEAIFERDSYLFDKIQYSWPVLSALLYVASANDDRLDVVDFGGSLGSSYYQNKAFLNHLKELRWNIVEQPIIVKCGQENFTNEHLRFYGGMDECLKENSPMVAFISGTLQYLPKPYDVLDQMFKNKIKFILMDRLVVNDSRDLITVQSVNPIIYKASYPLWIFKEKNILDYFSKNDYELVVDFDSNVDSDFIVKKTGVKGRHKGYLFKLKD